MEVRAPRRGLRIPSQRRVGTLLGELAAHPEALARVVHAVLAGIVGLLVGSFANVCIYRLPLRRSIAWPGSACPACARPIAWFDNIPVLSFVLLRGRCRACRAPISIRYPLIETANGLAWT